MAKRLKVMTFLGTRPEIIRLAKVIQLLDNKVDHKLVHTGQNYDYELNQIFFKDLGLKKPDYFLEVNTSSLGIVLGEILIKSEKVLLQEKPDAVLILGDTNSSIACIIAKRLRIPIFHMEAGNRCFDANVPEEINRKVIDHLADFNLVYTEHARRHLLSEGLPHRRIYLTGSPLCEVLNEYLPRIKRSSIMRQLKLKKGAFFLMSAHREENVDNQQNLKRILSAMNALVEKYGYPMVVTTHPRTRKRLEALKGFKIDSRISFLKPFGFFDYVRLQMDAACTLSDSGTISEESSILRFPAVTIRNAIERPEAMDTGSIIMTGHDMDTIVNAVSLALDETTERKFTSLPTDYAIRDTSWRVLKLILGLSKLSNRWANIAPETEITYK